MEYIHVTACDDFRAVNIYESYCSTFPENERRCEKQYRALFQHPKVKVCSLLDELQNVGYMICWTLTDFVFIEHFEIFPEYRNRQYGSQIMADLFRDYSKIVLEIEPEDCGVDAARRLQFYERNGFHVIDKLYVQPPYDANKEPLDLWLLANWQPEDIESLKEEIYDVVYCRC